jgi:ATP-dependent DNA helicase RecQ
VPIEEGLFSKRNLTHRLSQIRDVSEILIMDWLNFQNKICSLDLESNGSGEVFALAAVHQDKNFQRHAPYKIKQVLKEFDGFTHEADFLLGHNIILHDLPLCQAINPNLGMFSKPVIDTLFLSPLAFPENPYHRLVKDYKLLHF